MPTKAESIRIQYNTMATMSIYGKQHSKKSLEPVSGPISTKFGTSECMFVSLGDSK